MLPWYVELQFSVQEGSEAATENSVMRLSGLRWTLWTSSLAVPSPPLQFPEALVCCVQCFKSGALLYLEKWFSTLTAHWNQLQSFKKKLRARSRGLTSLQQTVITTDYILLGKIRDHEFMLIKSSCRINWEFDDKQDVCRISKYPALRRDLWIPRRHWVNL